MMRSKMGDSPAPRSRWAPLACILILAGISSAQDGLSLSNFAPLATNTGPRLPIGCRIAYTSPIRGCRRRDFVEGAICSEACLAGLDQMEDNIQAQCGGVLAPVNTLLGQALLGNLVRIMCPANNGEEEEEEEPTPTRISTSDEAPTPTFISISTTTTSTTTEDLASSTTDSASETTLVTSPSASPSPSPSPSFPPNFDENDTGSSPSPSLPQDPEETEGANDGPSRGQSDLLELFPNSGERSSHRWRGATTLAAAAIFYLAW